VDISTKFDIGDTAYFNTDAADGNMIPMIVEKIETSTANPNFSEILYTLGSNAKFAKSQGYEGDLLTYAEAVIIAEAALENDIDELQDRIDDL